MVDMALEEKLGEVPEVFGSGILELVGSNNGVDYTMDHTWSKQKSLRTWLWQILTPLGEHEVLPQNEHYVVHERPINVRPAPKQEKAKKKKKDKKKRHLSMTNLVRQWDLLGFDNFEPAGRTSVAHSMANKPTGSSGMGMSAPDVIP